MSEARTVWHELAASRTEVANRQFGGGLLGIALLCMLCAAETAWLLTTGGSEAVNVVAAAEGIHLM
jgi:hypothetical protein